MSQENDRESSTGVPSEEELHEHRMRMRFGWDDLIEEMIQEGQEKGAFDNLKGEGKPLDLKRNQYAAEWELAHSLMKENNIRPPWIDKRNRIVAEIELFRDELVRRWTQYFQTYALTQGKAQRIALARQWTDYCRQWEVRLDSINKKIDDFNLSRPSDNLEIFGLILEEELQRIGAARNLADGR